MPRVSQEHLDARRQQILAGARRCFVRNGFHATSMQDVLREAGLSAGATYRYFRSKEEIVVAVAADALSHLQAAFDEVAEADPPPPIDQVVLHICTAVERLDAERDVTKLAIQIWGEAVRSPTLADFVRDTIGTVQGRIAALVREYQRRGEVSPDVPAAQVARAMLGFLPGFIIQRAILGDIDAATYAGGVRALLGAGVRHT
jgi:AcrR family transcriptional regulator